jgi:transmembrane sensor
VTSGDLPPGSNKAILKLADGKTIVLDSAAKGLLAKQGGSEVQKTDSGQLTYTAQEKGELAYNTLTTPRGGQYQLRLADGTKVWLNAASSITYPVAFSGERRDVTITGEAYLEVAKDAARPFRVQIPNAVGSGSPMEIEVLGTGFDVNAYADEPTIRTTLVEGSIRVSASGSGTIVQPGQQVEVGEGGKGIRVIDHADVDEALAWKNGRFYFHNADLPAIMRQVSRWYDVDIRYAGEVPAGHYNGKPTRDLSAKQMLKLIEYSGVKYRIEGKTIVIE